MLALVDALNSILPQTQCQRCGYCGCMPYAQAMASGEALPNRCPPGDVQGLHRLAATLGIAPMALDPSCGAPGPRLIAQIDNSLCIGCTKCIPVCPTDAIVGAPKLQHWVITDACTGCELCLPPCPVNCISFKIATKEQSHLTQWLQTDADQARERYDRKQKRANSNVALTSASGPVTSSPVTSSPVELALETARQRAQQRLSLNPPKVNNKP